MLSTALLTVTPRIVTGPEEVIASVVPLLTANRASPVPLVFLNVKFTWVPKGRGDGLTVICTLIVCPVRTVSIGAIVTVTVGAGGVSEQATVQFGYSEQVIGDDALSKKKNSDRRLGLNSPVIGGKLVSREGAERLPCSG
jgi:hypothetical protein